jgi:hypothetical protein
MKHWFVMLTAAAAFTAFAPAEAPAQGIAVEVPGAGVRIGEPPPPRRQDRIIEREVRGGPECREVSVTETGPDGSSRTVTRKKCD